MRKTPSLTMLLNCFSAIKCISIYNKQIRRRKFLTCIHVYFILFAEENHDHDLPGGFNHHPGGSPRWLPVMTSDRTSMDSPPGGTSSQDITSQPPSYFMIHHNDL